MTFFHIGVFEWSLSTLKTLDSLWPSVRASLPPIIFGQGDVTDAKWIKFVKRFGFQPIGDCLCSDGENRLIYAHFRK